MAQGDRLHAYSANVERLGIDDLEVDVRDQSDPRGALESVGKPLPQRCFGIGVPVAWQDPSECCIEGLQIVDSAGVIGVVVSKQYCVDPRDPLP
jgi:hypothetical protein